MIDAEAKALLADRFSVSRETLSALEEFVSFLVEENSLQNLVSRASLEEVWGRHILDSAQLLQFSHSGASWLDLGTGAGFPGLIVAVLHDGPVTLVEERKKRVEFLSAAASVLKIETKVEIVQNRVERLQARPFDIISARAFAPLSRLLDLSHSFSTAKTRFLLPKGRNARSELEEAGTKWQGRFRLEPSLTDAEAQIIIAEGVSRRPASRGGKQ